MRESAFEKSQIYALKTSVEFANGSIVSKQVTKSAMGNVTLFAFDEGQGLSEHTAPFDALVVVIEGTANVTIAKENINVQEGEMVIMPANIPHALKAEVKFKMLLVMIKDQGKN